MKKCVLLFILSVTLLSCKSKSMAVGTTPEAPAVPAVASAEMSAKKIIEQHYNNKIDFSTLYIKSSARYADDKLTQNVTAEIKIKNNEQILVSVRFLGITMAKALITPKAVSYYEKLNGTYFEGDFSSLSQWLGTDLDYEKVQNLLLGKAIDNLNKGKYQVKLEEQSYQLVDQNSGSTSKSYFLDALRYLVQKQEVAQAAEERNIKVEYGAHQDYAQGTLPTQIAIQTQQKKGTTDIKLEYNGISFNEELSFPYSVPNGYKRILIK